MYMRPGDIFCAEVSRVQEAVDYRIPIRLRGKIFEVAGWIDLKDEPRPYCFTSYWNLNKLGPPPKVGDYVNAEFREPPAYMVRGGKPVQGKLVMTSICKGKDKAMFNRKASKAPSRDRVHMYLGRQYFQTGAIYSVLEQAFGLSKQEASDLLRHRDGFEVICRPSQFARFMIFRNDAGLTNGFKDLQPKLFVPEPPQDPYEELAHVAGVNACAAGAVAEALGFSRREVEGYLKESGRGSCRNLRQVDVADRAYCPND